MKFRDDIDIENTWIVSDTHFGHKNIVAYCSRPQDHEAVMIREWRETVPQDATVIHLGDLNYGNNGRFKNVISPQLTGTRKLLVAGNHDQQTYNFYRTAGFNLIKPFKIQLRRGRQGFVSARSKHETHFEVSFSHYPWNSVDEGTMWANHWRLHGHIHNNGYTRNGYVPFLRNHINMSVEQTRYRPVNLKLALDAAILGLYDATTEEQIEEVRNERRRRLESST